MQDVLADLEQPVPSLVPKEIPSMSDDECLARLAEVVKDYDSGRLEEVARLVGRLAVTIE
jgi:hypothetical protein